MVAPVVTSMIPTFRLVKASDTVTCSFPQRYLSAKGCNVATVYLALSGAPVKPKSCNVSDQAPQYALRRTSGAAAYPVPLGLGICSISPLIPWHHPQSCRVAESKKYVYMQLTARLPVILASSMKYAIAQQACRDLREPV